MQAILTILSFYHTHTNHDFFSFNMCHHEMTVCKCCRTPIGKIHIISKCKMTVTACEFIHFSVNRYDKCTYCMGFCDAFMDLPCNFDSKRTIVKDFYYPEIRQ